MASSSTPHSLARQPSKARPHLPIPGRQILYHLINWLLLWGALSCISGETSRASWGAAVLLWDWRGALQESDVVTETIVQAEEADAEITRELEKQEKKCLKKKKKGWLQFPSPFGKLQQCSGGVPGDERKTEKRRKWKPQEVCRETTMEESSVSFSKPKEKKSSSKEELG